MEAWDVLVVGGGVGGLRAALAAASSGAAVLVLEPAGPGGGQSAGAGAGLVADLHAVSLADHLTDTLRAAGWTLDQDIAAARIGVAVDELEQLERGGLSLRRGAGGLPHLAKLPGHGSARVASAGDSTSRRVRELLEEQCAAAGVERRADHPVVRLVRSGGAVHGVVALDVARGALVTVRSNAVVLAGDDHGQLWASDGGDGQAAVLAHEAGLALRDLDQVTWSPLCVDVVGTRLPALLLGDGARVHALSGEAIPHDAGMAAMAAAMQGEADGCVLDARSVDAGVRAWYTDTAEALASRAGLDLWDAPVAVAPRITGTSGGLATDGHGRVVDGAWDRWAIGLYAVGGASAGGVQDTLPGHDLLDALAGGAAAGAHAATWAASHPATSSAALTTAAASAESAIEQALSAGPEDAPSAGSLVRELRAAMSAAFSGGATSSALSRAVASLASLAAFGAQAAGVHARDRSTVLNQELIDALRLPGLVRVAQATVGAAMARAGAADDGPETWNHTLATSEGSGWLPLRRGPTDWIIAPEAAEPAEVAA